MWFLPDRWIPVLCVGKGSLWPRACQMICRDLSKENGHLNPTSPSAVVPRVPSSPQLAWRQAHPSCLGVRWCVLSLKAPLRVFWACLSLLLACAWVRFLSFGAGFQVLLVLGTLDIHEVIDYLFQSWEGYKNVPRWQCLWIAFTISSPHHPRVCFLSCVFLQ